MLNNAKWIKSPDNTEERCYNFYTDFAITKPVKSAVLTATAFGLYTAFINGKRVGNEILTPYWTEYTKRLQYQTYDVTDMLESNTSLSIICAEGWALGRIHAGAEHRNHYCDNISLLFSLDITYEDGTTDCILSDENIKVASSHIIASGIYDGETIDMTADITEFGNALPDTQDSSVLIPQEGERVIEQEIIKPVRYIETPSGEKVIDFGQNLSGYVEVTVKGKKGDRIVISHAEILDKDGNVYTANLRSAKQQNTYILSGEGTEVFKPMFTWQGFQYIRLDEYPFDEVDLSCFRAIVIHSELRRTGDFSCGHTKLNQLYHNIIWGQKCNYVDVPTDCPQRDERLGWAGDTQVFCRTAAINYDVEKFFDKWLGDLAAGQDPDGGVSWLVPKCNLNYPENVSSAWGDAATICPWEIYMAYGNKKVLEKQFESMKAWVEYIRNFGDEEYLWIGGKQFGDWLAMDNEDGSYKGATPFDYISTAFYAYSTELLIKAGKVLGKDMSEYEKLYTNIVKAFQDTFIKDGEPISKTQTAYVLALRFGLCTDVQKTAEGLAKLVRDNDTKLTTGFVGTPYLLHALSDSGYTDLAFDLLLQEEFPSWLFSVNQGATTMWEHWDGLKADGTFWSEKMNSFNHYAYGAVYDWVFGVAAGIKVLEDGAGYKHISIAPNPDKRIGFMKASVDSRQGMVSSHWYYKGDNVHFEFEIPENTVAEITLPNGTHETVGGGKYLYVI